MKELKIKPILNGYLVEAGCTTVAFTSIKSLLKELEVYLKDSSKAEKLWLKDALNKPSEDPGVNVAQGTQAIGH